MFVCLYLALQELEALLVENIYKLRLKVLVAVPGAARHRSVRLQAVEHVDLLLRGLKKKHTSGSEPDWVLSASLRLVLVRDQSTFRLEMGPSLVQVQD